VVGSGSTGPRRGVREVGGSAAMVERPLVRQAIDRALAERRDAYAEEVQRLVDATYRVIERTGSVDPTVRDILAEAELSTQAFYRQFRSKDELLAVLLDDGRRRLVETLTRRMDGAADPAGRIRAWIEGVMAQAVDATAASRTRPFLVQSDRLAERFPDAQRGSIALLIGLLEAPLRDLGAGRDAPRDAAAIYHLTIGAMEQHVRDRTRPSRAEIDHLVRFALRAVSATG
jgi:AcrR family transcriptional regulator